MPSLSFPVVDFYVDLVLENFHLLLRSHGKILTPLKAFTQSDLPELLRERHKEKMGTNKNMIKLSPETSFEDVHDILEKMRQQESTTYAQKQIDNELVALWRRMLIDWMFFVVDYCSLQRHSVAAAAFFLDVAVSRKLCSTPEEHQLAAATALQLALKTHDSAIIKLERLVKLGRGVFTEEDVVKMETKILMECAWHLHPPSVYCFLRQYEQLLPVNVSKSTRSVFSQVNDLVSELTILDDKYLCYSPSEIAYASMLMAMEMVDYEDLTVVHRQCFLFRMSTVAKMSNNSLSIRRIFEDLKNSLDESPKLQKIIDSIAKQKKLKAQRWKFQATSSSDQPKVTQSPTQVMVRLVSG